MIRSTTHPRSLGRRSQPASVRWGLALASALTVSPVLFAQDALTKLEKENADLKKRLEALEAVAKAEGLLGEKAPDKHPLMSKMAGMKIEGFVTASYFYDTSTPADGSPNAYLWNRGANDFSINKIKLTLSSPAVERSGDTWGAGYRASLIFGEDAPIVNTGGVRQGFDELREAYVELNAPIGTGLNIKAGQLISLLNWESGDGGAANPNFSQGNQWFYTGNGPAAGVQLGYEITDSVGVKFRVQNGLYAGPVDGNTAKTFLGSLGIKPDDKTWISLVGFGGKESDTLSLMGGSVLAGRQLTEKLGSGFEFDYFHFEPAGAADEELWSVGGWLWYTFTPKVGLALRGEFLSSDTGWGFGGGGLLGFPGGPGDDIYGLTLTLNYSPVPNVKIQPEIRFDGTTRDNGFDGEDARVIVGAGVSYLF